MKLKITDLNANDLIRVLGQNDFGLDLAYDAREELIAATVWSERLYQGENTPGGYIVGQITRQPTSTFARYDLLIDSGYVNRTRVHGLVTDLLNATWRA